MIICVCRRVSDRDIARAAREGCDSFDALQAELGVATCCGKCHDCARQTFEQSLAAAQLPAPVQAHTPAHPHLPPQVHVPVHAHAHLLRRHVPLMPAHTLRPAAAGHTAGLAGSPAA